MNPTEAFVVLFVVLALAWEAVTLWREHDNIYTISQVMHDTAKKHPMIAFVLGVLIGHWFWPV